MDKKPESRFDPKPFGLSQAEFTEREMLLELQRNNRRWFSQREFDRLQQLSNKMFLNAGASNTK